MIQPIYPDLMQASVFITGGGSGIGAALTEGFLRQGDKVAFVGTSDASPFVEQMAKATGNRPLFIQCDITNTDALRAALRHTAQAHGPDGVRVNALAPGWVMTQKQQQLWATPEALAAHLERQCLKAPLQPQDMLGPVLFLASEASGAITGQLIAADGGVVTTG